jgi:hypothetical protein
MLTVLGAQISHAQIVPPIIPPGVLPGGAAVLKVKLLEATVTQVNLDTIYAAKVEYNPGAGKKMKTITIELFENDGKGSIKKDKQGKEILVKAKTFTTASGVKEAGGTDWFGVQIIAVLINNTPTNYVVRASGTDEANDVVDVNVALPAVVEVRW